MHIYPYKPGSESAKALAQALGIKRIKHKGSKFKGGLNKWVINWGCSNLPNEVLKCRVLNPRSSVDVAANKLTAFRKMDEADVRVPEFSTDQEFIKGQLQHGSEILARTILNGHSGAGIVIMKRLEHFVEAPLYTLYIPKKQEYRVHVFNDKVVDVQRKARRQDVADDDVNWRIRSHANGFIFARNEDHEVPNDVAEQAVKAVKALGLDFGAVDVIWNDKQQKAYVLEVNTAPGLTGQTLEGYVKQFKEFI